MKPPPHEATVQAEDAVLETVTQTFFSLEGRADPLELILHALEATGASGLGRLLDVREFDGDPRR